LLVCLALSLSASACSRCSSDGEKGQASGKPSAAPSARAPEPKLEVPPPAAPPVTPTIPPELVACGERDFYRITPNALQIFEIAEKLPPPQIRGSRVARQVHQVAIDEPTNLFSPAKKSVVVIAKGGVFRYALGEIEARQYAPISEKAPLLGWPRGADSFRVRSAGDRSSWEYTLGRAPSGDAGVAKAPANILRRAAELPEFDGRLFTVLADGTPLYSTSKGLVRGDESHPVPFSEPSGPATLLFADSSADRYWAADASGKLALWDRNQAGSPISSASVPGVVIDTALEGDRVAVLSVALIDGRYQPRVTIYSNGREQRHVDIGPHFGRTQPTVDLCLVVGRPWIVVGGTRWMQLLDLETRRLLAEW
jgi:hypothetical protein